MSFFFEWYGDHRELHVLTHSCPTRRSPGLHRDAGGGDRRAARARRSQCGEGGVRTEGRDAADRAGALFHARDRADRRRRSEEHTSELQSLMRISYAVFCMEKITTAQYKHTRSHKTSKGLDLSSHQEK